jgi:formylglycine-generating enzyme required for sulfatase activity
MLSGCGKPPAPSISFDSSGAEYVEIPAGEFKMFARHPAFPTRSVFVSGFLMKRTEVTNAEYDRFKKRPRPSWSKDDTMPVVGLTRREVMDYIKWLSKAGNHSYGLPTDAQWERAARGGLEDLDYPWGNRFSEERALVGRGLGVSMSNPSMGRVGSLPPNNFGLFDMCGNATEMVRERYTNDLPDSRRDPIGLVDESGKKGVDPYIVRGLGVGELLPTVWCRTMEFDDSPGEFTGFRLVMESRRVETPPSHSRGQGKPK